MELPKLVLIFFSSSYFNIEYFLCSTHQHFVCLFFFFFKNWASYFLLFCLLLGYLVHMIFLERFGDLTLTRVCLCFIFLELFLLTDFFYFHPSIFGLLGIEHCYFFKKNFIRLARPHNLSREFAMLTHVDSRCIFCYFSLILSFNICLSWNWALYFFFFCKST